MYNTMDITIDTTFIVGLASILFGLSAISIYPLINSANNIVNCGLVMKNFITFILLIVLIILHAIILLSSVALVSSVMTAESGFKYPQVDCTTTGKTMKCKPKMSPGDLQNMMMNSIQNQ
jgi:hypothetical protein